MVPNNVRTEGRHGKWLVTSDRMNEGHLQLEEGKTGSENRAKCMQGIWKFDYGCMNPDARQMGNVEITQLD